MAFALSLLDHSDEVFQHILGIGAGMGIYERWVAWPDA